VAAASFSTPAAAAPEPLSETAVTSEVKRIIADRSDDGVFRFRDTRTGEQLSLVLDDVRIVRGLPRYGWFPNVMFHSATDPKKKYALDFWLQQEGDGARLQAIRIHKVPQPDGDGWMSITRPPLPWWWLPTLRRSSQTAAMPAWQVLGSIHTHILADAEQGVTKMQSGEEPVELELVDLHQPVGKSRADGRYFACAEFRKLGSPAAIYFADYWLEPKSGAVSIGSVLPSDGTLNEADKAASEPRCDIKGIAFDAVD
jgi:hypothetical protein